MASTMAYFNGEFIPQSEVGIALHDSGFVFGATATDLCRTYHGKPFLLDEHLARFHQSCHAIGIHPRLSFTEWTGITDRLLQSNYRGHDLCIVMLATPGPLGYYAGVESGLPSGPTVIMHTFPVPFARYATWMLEGATLCVPEVQHLSSKTISPGIKQRSRLHWWLAIQQTRQKGHPILLNEYGHLTETPAANFLIAQDKKLLSPRKTDILNGVSLWFVENLCEELGLMLQEEDMTLARCQEADEALICGTAFGLAPVRSIEGVKLTSPGPIFEQLHRLWSERVGLDLREQVLTEARVVKE